MDFKISVEIFINNVVSIILLTMASVLFLWLMVSGVLELTVTGFALTSLLTLSRLPESGWLQLKTNAKYIKLKMFFNQMFFILQT